MKIRILVFLVSLSLVFSCEKKPEHNITSVTLQGGETYEFQSYFSGGNKSVLWNFGDGLTSTEPNPVHKYTSPGTYPVTLTKYKNNKFFDKYTAYNVKVEQLYKPRVYKTQSYCQPEIEFNYDEYTYFYKDYFAKFNFVENPDIDSDNYRYQILFNGQMVDTGQSSQYGYFESFELTDTGFFNVEFTVFDENNISDTFDTIVYVGNHMTNINLLIPDFYLSQLGNITEKKVLLYDNNKTYTYKDRDYLNAASYNGPSSGSFVMTSSSGSVYINNGTGSNWFDGDSFYGLDVYNMPSTSDNTPFSIEIPAHEIGDDDDYDNIHLIIVIIGDLGMSYGQISIELLPGSQTPIYDLNLTLKTF